MEEFVPLTTNTQLDADDGVKPEKVAIFVHPYPKDINADWFNAAAFLCQGAENEEDETAHVALGLQTEREHDTLRSRTENKRRQSRKACNA